MDVGHMHDAPATTTYMQVGFSHRCAHAMVGRVRFFCTYRKSRLGPKEHAVNRNERVAHTLVHELVSLEKHIHTHTHTHERVRHAATPHVH